MRYLVVSSVLVMRAVWVAVVKMDDVELKTTVVLTVVSAVCVRVCKAVDVKFQYRVTSNVAVCVAPSP